VDKQDFSIVIAEQDGQVHLVEQFRYPIGRRSWEFPMGGWPPGKSGSMLELAQAELQEETGLTAGAWRLLGNLHEAPGFCSQGFGVYYATDLHPGPHDREESEIDMVHRAVTRPELRAMIVDGTIVDSTTVAAFGLLLLLETNSEDAAH
jgi:8-oxo-dGTP pyrophosphatase MutT (NUDIX family)